MLGPDDRIVELSTGGSVVLALLVALLVGLRHATDPDHLTAVSTLVLGDRERGARSAGRLGLAWGAGHAVTLVILGLPVVLLHRSLPAPAERVAEAAIGTIIVVLAVRLLLRWRRGTFHTHVHEHDGVPHAHPHVHVSPDAHDHAHPEHPHPHAHEAALGRSPQAAFGIGLLHGAGGSAGVGVLLIGAMPDATAATAALLLFAAATASSMALVSAAWGRALACGPVARRLVALAPVLGSLSLLFGVWYGTSALV
jgi:ABC-type nickel/cobalt efflux system permease component RcnA